tara:strand:- start:316 stop:447 length:132 start_codon:yes stop_codon:yes gene_type:complete
MDVVEQETLPLQVQHKEQQEEIQLLVQKQVQNILVVVAVVLLL